MNRKRIIKFLFIAFIILIIIFLPYYFKDYFIDFFQIPSSESINEYMDRVLSVIFFICIFCTISLIVIALESFRHDSFVGKHLEKFNFFILAIALIFTAISSILQFVSTTQNSKVIETEQRSKSIDRYFILKEKYDLAIKERGGRQFLEERVKQLELISDLCREDSKLFIDDICFLIEEIGQDVQPLLYPCFQSITILDDNNNETKKQLMTYLDRSLTRNEQILLYWLSNSTKGNEQFYQEMVKNNHLQEAIDFFDSQYALDDIINSMQKSNFDVYDALKIIPERDNEMELRQKLEQEFTALYLHGCLIGDRSCLNKDKPHDCVIKVFPKYVESAQIVLPSTIIEDEEEINAKEEYDRKLNFLMDKYWNMYIRDYSFIDARREYIKQLEISISNVKKELKEKSFIISPKTLQLKQEISEMEKNYSYHQIKLRLAERFIENYQDNFVSSEDENVDIDTMIQFAENRIRALKLQKTHISNIKNAKYCITKSLNSNEPEHYGCTPEQNWLRSKLENIPDKVLQQMYDMRIKETEHEIEQLQEQKRGKVTQLKSKNAKIAKTFLEKNPLDRMLFFILNDNFALIHTFSETWKARFISKKTGWRDDETEEGDQHPKV
jgi:hypothetical protein